MEKKIDQLLSGTFEYEQPQMLFSCDKLIVTLAAGETGRGEIYIGTEENVKLRGYITSSDRRLVPGATEFSGTTISLPYGADAAGMKPGEQISGWLCFTSNIGEYKLPFEIRVPKEEAATAQGTIQNLDQFARLAKEDFREAFRVFTSGSFSTVMESEPVKHQAMGVGLTHQPVTYQHLEEFLVGMKKKEPVTITLEQQETSIYEVKEDIQESIDIKKSGWGHLRLEIEAIGGFLELPRRVLMDEDFIGSHDQISYVIHADKLGEGRSTGRIIVRSPYQELTYTIHASQKPESSIDIRSREKRHGVSIYRDYLAFRMGKMDFKTCSAACHFELNALKEAGCYYPEYQLLEAYLLHKENRDEEANNILKVYTSKKFNSSEIEFAGVW
ncbi:MAG: hypothetical protein IJW67_03760, partial [Blautia sp.]|nr:hypothetical protein [Blautia sp.]